MNFKNAYTKSALVLVFSFIAITGAFAQFSVGFEYQLPMGTFGDSFNGGIGGTLRYDKGLNDNMTWGVSAGYISYGAKNVPSGGSASTSLIPIVGGIKYYFTELNKGFYGGADLGFVFASATASYSGASASVSETKFGFMPGIGYRTGPIDFAVRYNLVGDLNNVGLRLAYVFGGGN